MGHGVQIIGFAMAERVPVVGDVAVEGQGVTQSGVEAIADQLHRHVLGRRGWRQRHPVWSPVGQPGWS